MFTVSFPTTVWREGRAECTTTRSTRATTTSIVMAVKSLSETPVIIEAAINGGTKPDRNPHVPLTVDELRRDAVRCFDAGAAIVHAHNHDYGLNGAAAADAYLEVWR